MAILIAPTRLDETRPAQCSAEQRRAAQTRPDSIKIHFGWQMLLSSPCLAAFAFKYALHAQPARRGVKRTNLSSCRAADSQSCRAINAHAHCTIPNSWHFILAIPLFGYLATWLFGYTYIVAMQLFGYFAPFRLFLSIRWQCNAAAVAVVAALSCVELSNACDKRIAGHVNDGYI